jgi:tetratricopeptide (TPR) repeat protein
MTKRSLAIALAMLALTADLSGQLKPKTKAEYDALNKMFSATTPDDRIAAGEEVIANFEKTEFKAIVFFTIAQAYVAKKDEVKAIVYGERALEADPKNYQASLMLAQLIAVKVRENDLDKNERYNDAEKYAKMALDSIPAATKPNATLTDDQWANEKKNLAADAHQYLGIVAMGRKKYDVAVTEFGTAVDTAHDPDPAAIVRLAAAQNKVGKYDEAIANADKVMAIENIAPSIKQFAQAEKVRAFTAKQAAAKKPQ